MIHHGDTEARTKLLHESLTEQVIGAAIEVHRALGPGPSGVCLRGVSLLTNCISVEFHFYGKYHWRLSIKESNSTVDIGLI